MGKIAKPQRSKKHKKIKSVDPFYHGSRKDKRSEGLNQKPKNYEQEVPKKLRNLGLTIDETKLGKTGKRSRNKFLKHPDEPKKSDTRFQSASGKPNPQQQPSQNPKKRKQTPEKTPADDSLESDQPKSKKARKQQKLTQEAMNEYIDNLQPTRKFVEPFTFKQKSSETQATFMRRVEKATETVLAKSKIDDHFDISDEKKIKMKVKAKKGMSEKKKQRLKEKKQKKAVVVKEKKQEKFSGFNALKDKVEFGEVVHAPPVLSVRPKKAVVSNDVDRPGLRMPDLKAAIARNTHESTNGNKTVKERTEVIRRPGQSIKRKALSVKQQRATDAQRENVIAAYRQMKKKSHS